jgi:hypothetical protein
VTGAGASPRVWSVEGNANSLGRLLAVGGQAGADTRKKGEARTLWGERKERQGDAPASSASKQYYNGSVPIVNSFVHY